MIPKEKLLMNERIDITIKPTMSCNMKCKHCFNGNYFLNSGIMEVEHACMLMQKACHEYHNVKIIFHGGEPTLAGITFFRLFFERQHKLKNAYNTTFDNVFTTNGLLLTDDFIRLLKENNVLINVSFDGPYNHILRSNSDHIQHVLFKLREANCNFRCFCTLSKESVLHLLDIYYWFRDNNIPFKTLPIERRGFAKNDDELIMTPETLASKFAEVYNVWVKDKSCKISYSTFEEFAKLRRYQRFRKPWFGRKVALHPDGNIFVYGRPNDANYCIGNIRKINGIKECFESDQYKQYIGKILKIKSLFCPSCYSHITCNGNNIELAYLYVDDIELIKYSCRQSSLIDQFILPINDRISKDFRMGKGDQYNDFVYRTFSNEICL